MLGALLIFGAVFGVSGTAGIVSQDDTFSSSEIQDRNPVPMYPLNQKKNLAFGAYSIPTYPDYFPTNSHTNSRDEQSNSDVAPTRHTSLETWSSVIAKSLVPLSSFTLQLAAKGIVYIFKFIAMILISIALTTSICTFTPLCHITFAGVGFNKTQIVEMTGPYITRENLNEGSIMIGRAIDSFKEIQSESEKKKNMTSEEIEKGNITSVAAAINRRRRQHIQ